MSGSPAKRKEKVVLLLEYHDGRGEPSKEDSIDASYLANKKMSDIHNEIQRDYCSDDGKFVK